MCYRDGTPNVDGTIYSVSGGNARCGTSAASDARCPDQQCCSQWGYCGPVPQADGTYWEQVTGGKWKKVTKREAFNMYCRRNQGDWRQIDCDDVGNFDEVYNTENGTETESSTMFMTTGSGSITEMSASDASTFQKSWILAVAAAAFALFN